MAWARIDRNFDWPVPGKRAVMAFRAGTVAPVTRDQLAAIKAARAGIEVKRPVGLRTDKSGKVVRL